MKEIIEKKGYKPIEYKSIGIEAGFDIAKPSGYLNAFGVKDSQSDIVHFGAFKNSLQKRGPETNATQKIAYLKFHDMSRPIGKFTKLIEDSKGLYYEAELDDTQDGEETKVQYKTGSINQHSIGYNYIFDEKSIKYSQDEDTYHVYDVVLWEGSAVTLGSNPETPFTGFKSLTLEEKTLELYEYIENICRNLDSKTQYQVRQGFIKSLNLIEIGKEAATKALLKAKEIDQKNNQHSKLLQMAAVLEGFKNIKLPIKQ